MKHPYLLLLILLFLNLTVCAQITVGERFIGRKTSPLSKDLRERVKSSDLVFLKPDYMDADSIRLAVEDLWTYGNLVIDDNNSPKTLDYILSGAAILDLNTYKVTDGGNYNAIRTFLDFRLYDVDKLTEKLNGLNKKKYKGGKLSYKFSQALTRCRIPFARVLLHDSPRYTKSFDSLETQEAFQTINSENYFRNLDYGMLRNYFQAIVNAVDNNDGLSYFKEVKSPDLKALRGKPLYIPDFALMKFDARTGDLNDNLKFKTKLLKHYNGDYKVVDYKKINEMILAQEDFYYVRYTRVVTERFLEVVHSTTGEILYNDHSAGMAKYNLSSKHFKKLYEAITD